MESGLSIHSIKQSLEIEKCLRMMLGGKYISGTEILA